MFVEKFPLAKRFLATLGKFAKTVNANIFESEAGNFVYFFIYDHTNFIYDLQK